MHPLQPAVRKVRRAVKAVVHPALAPLAIRAFRARAAACRNRADAIDLAASFDYAAIRIAPVQVRSEIAAFLEVLAARAPRTVLEVGTADGGSLFLFTRVAAPDAHLVSIDLPGGEFGGGYPAYKAALYRAFARPGQRIDLLRADSHDRATADRVSRLFGQGAVDLLFIDGDHSYEGVKSDHDLYAPLVREGGTIAFHDIVPGPASNVGGVPRFWRELKATSEAREIVADWNQGGYGIGYLTKGSA
ncbi:MAG TPA: class I SAM-dependent methyltransferase [Candidatus Eisenbacteria bacterium]|nr:class I SAM-dependent methyltransferase [Candidatus Eisenbacteria bacterium]